MQERPVPAPILVYVCVCIIVDLIYTVFISCISCLLRADRKSVV